MVIRSFCRGRGDTRVFPGGGGDVLKDNGCGGGAGRMLTNVDDNLRFISSLLENEKMRKKNLWKIKEFMKM